MCARLLSLANRVRLTFWIGFYVPLLVEHIAYGVVHRWYFRHLGAQILKDLIQYYFVSLYTTLTLHAVSFHPSIVEINADIDRL